MALDYLPRLEIDQAPEAEIFIASAPAQAPSLNLVVSDMTASS